MSCFGKKQQRPTPAIKQQIKFLQPTAPVKEKKDKNVSTNQKVPKETVIFLNEYLDHRDEKIIIPFQKQRNQKVTALNTFLEEDVAQWLVKVNYTISSRGFRHLIDGNLTENQCKAYTSKNILLNLKEYINSFINLKEEQKQELMTKIGQIETDILGEVMLKYPQNSLRGASKRIRSVIKKIDNRANDEYDFLLKNEIVINYQQDGHYTSELMTALNKMISFSGDIFIPEKGINDTQDTYFQIWSELVDYIVLNDAKKNQKRFFQGFDAIFNYEGDKMLPLLFQNSINQDSLRRKQKEDLMQTDTNQNQEEIHRAKLKINHKIPLEAPIFTDDQIHSGEFKIRNSSVLRVIAKWTYELLQKFRQSKELILHRTEKFKLINKKLSSLENNQKIVLYEAIKKEKDKIEQYIVQLKKQYILLQTVFAQQKNRNVYENQDYDIEVYAMRIRQIYSQYLFKLLSRLIHSLKKVPREASQVYKQRYQNQLPEQEFRTNYQILRQVDLVTFKVGDLMRAKYSCSQIDFLRIYKNISEIHQNRPEKMKCIRIKNRLDQKDNDILLNVFFANKIICEIQLSFDRAIDQEGSQKKKYYTSFNHFLYQIRRSLLGPIGQFACILGQHDPVVSQYVLTDKNKALMNQNVSKNKSETKRELQLPFENQVENIQFCSDKILLQKNAGKQVKKLLTKIKEIYFLCENCGQLKKNINFDLLPDRRSIKTDEDDTTQTQPSTPKECKQCFLTKLQQLQENSRIHHLLDKIFKGKNAESDLFYNHLRNWTIKQIPINFKKEQIYLYLPYEGFLLAKSSKLISFIYFKRFVDSNFIYFATKQNDKLNIIYKISRILSEEECLTQIQNMTNKYFVFKFDQNVSIQDGSILNYGKEGEYEVGLCRIECCRQSVILGNNIMWQDFQQTINKQMIKKFFQYEKNVLYLNQMKLNNMINEVVMNDKRYDSACKSITMIEAEQSELTDIKFTSKMINLSDLYLRQNKKLVSLSGIQNCKNLKILYCNECNLTSLKELSGLQMLQELFVNQNQLTDLIGLQKSYSLKELSCYWNKISSLNPIKGCKNIEYLQIGLNSITSLKPIESLLRLKHLSFCRNRIDIIEGIQELKSLKSIDFKGHTNINSIGLLNKCKDLQKVICANTNIQTLCELQILNLLYLDISQCSKLRQFDLSRISCSSLQILIADNCLNLKRLLHLQFCKGLRQLYINLNPSLSSEQFNLIGRCTFLQILNIGQNKNLKALYFLQMLPNLMNLTCSNNQKLDNTHFTVIKKCTKLQTLILNNNPYLMSLQFLKSCSKLYYLNLSGTNIKHIDKPPFISKFQELRYLQLKKIKGLQISNFQFLKQAKQIQKIVISQIQDVQSLKGIETMTSLKQLLITKLEKPDPNRNKRFAQQISKFSVKLQRAIRLEEELQI